MSDALCRAQPGPIPHLPDAPPLPSTSARPPADSGMFPPSMQARSANRHDELLRILQEIDALPAEALMTSDLPEQADRLLTEINATRKPPAATTSTMRFQLIDRADTVNRCLLQLETASRRGNIPTPYPIDEDPLWLQAWAGKLRPNEVAKLANKFPQVRNALCVYIDASGRNHLARTFHAGTNLDFELDLRSRKTWRLMPAYDAIHRGPTANFIVLMKIILFWTSKDDSIPAVKEALEDFIGVRRQEDIASLIQHCKEHSWPETIAINPDSKDFFATQTHAAPVEHILFDLIVPIIAGHPTHSALLSLMADMDPERLIWALRPLNFKPTDTLIDSARTQEGRAALRRMKTAD